MEEKKSFEEQYIGIIIGALVFLIVVLFAIVMFIIIRHNKSKHNNRLGTKPAVDHVTMNMNHMHAFHPTLGGKVSNGTLYKGLATEEIDDHICNGGEKVLKGYSEPKDSIQGRNLPDLPSSSEMHGKEVLKNRICH